MVTYDPSYKTAGLNQYGADRPQVGSLYPTTTTVLQGLYVNANNRFFSTQTNNNTNDLYITRYDSGPGDSSTVNTESDRMIIRGGGHGLGLHAENPGDGNVYIWASLPDRLARFKYTAGFDGVPSALPGLTWKPQFVNYLGQYQESVYNFDTAAGWAIERQWDFSAPAGAYRERYTRRKISDINAGIDSGSAYGQVWLPANPPTMQGFATINDTLFRWVGAGNVGSGQPVTGADAMALEQYDWNQFKNQSSTPNGAGLWKYRKELPDLGKNSSNVWRDNRYEPEAAMVYRESDGKASLFVGVNVGAPGNYRYPIFTFHNIGQEA